jgi:hypothetical protein
MQRNAVMVWIYIKFSYCVRADIFGIYRPYFCKKGTTHKISIVQQKQEGGSILHMTGALTGRMSHTHLDYS